MRIKSRSKEELISLLADQSKEHKRELIILKKSIKSQRKHEKNVLCRLAVVMAYANWEGFIETSSIA